MRLGDLVRDQVQGTLSLSKVWSNLAALALTVGFLKNVWKFDATWDDYVGFGVGLTIVTVPALASKLIGLRYGGAAAESGTKTPTDGTLKP